jgi:glutathione S-transferase
MSDLYLYHHNSSVCAAKVRLVFAEKALDWDGEMLDLKAGDQFKPEYLKLNPKAVVPTLVHRGRTITESNIIIEYLDEAFPEPPLRPRQPDERAMMRHWLKRLDDGSDGIHYAASVISFAAAYRSQLIALMGGDTSDHIERALARSMNPNSQAWLREVMFRGLDAESCGVAARRLDALLNDFEQTLSGQPWLAGSGYSLADLAYTPYMTRLELLSFAEMWADKPRVSDWYARLNERSSYTEVIDRYRSDYIDVLRSEGERSWPRVRSMIADR